MIFELAIGGIVAASAFFCGRAYERGRPDRQKEIQEEPNVICGYVLPHHTDPAWKYEFVKDAYDMYTYSFPNGEKLLVYSSTCRIKSKNGIKIKDGFKGWEILLGPIEGSTYRHRVIGDKFSGGRLYDAIDDYRVDQTLMSDAYATGSREIDDARWARLEKNNASSGEQLLLSAICS